MFYFHIISSISHDVHFLHTPYSPRLTVGGARRLARKNLGKRHLIYFFECNDAPFTVLPSSRLTKWEAGFIEEYDLGKTAKSGNKNKAMLFDKALSIAQLENERPIEMRMDWNHQDTPVMKGSGGGSKGKTVISPVAEQRQQPQQQQRPKQSQQQQVQQPPKKKQKVHAVPPSGDSVNRKSAITQGSLIEPSEDGPLLCKILRRLPVGVSNASANAGLEFSTNVGFVTLPSRQNATFADIRRVAEKELDEDCFPGGMGKSEGGEGSRWKFYVPKLGELKGVFLLQL